MSATPEENILRAAKKVFTERGYNGTRLQEVADLAGINKAMLHYYYRSKEKLFRVVLSEAVRDVAPLIVGSLNSDRDVLGKLDDLVNNYTAFLLENPHLPLFIMHELSQNQGKFVTDFALSTGAQPVLSQFFEQVRVESEAGTIRDIKPVHLLLHVMSLTVFPFIVKPMVTEVAKLPDEAFSQILEERAREVTRFLRAGLQP